MGTGRIPGRSHSCSWLTQARQQGTFLLTREQQLDAFSLTREQQLVAFFAEFLVLCLLEAFQVNLPHRLPLRFTSHQ
jgi:hypothetical protein